MILIADSGSSKTDWRLIDNVEISQYACIGLNPDFVDETKVAEELNTTFDKKIKKGVTEVHFYGSGCSSERRNKIIEDGMVRVFRNAEIHIYHDLLGAARAACAKNRGIAGILGTGSNCCFYDGEYVTKEFRSGGYILSDEGGGVDIGKRILKAFIEGRMDEALENRFTKRYKTSADEILENIYKKPRPNKYIAGFSRFAYHNRENPFISNLLIDSFTSYFQNMVLRYEECHTVPLNLTGSIAFYYQEVIRKVASDFNVQVGTVLEKPISGLTLYHTNLGAE